MLEFYSNQNTQQQFQLLPDAEQALQLFCACRPRYETTATMAGVHRHYDGICRAELAAVMSMNGVKRKQQQELLRQVLLVEKGARSGASA